MKSDVDFSICGNVLEFEQFQLLERFLEFLGLGSSTGTNISLVLFLFLFQINYLKCLLKQNRITSCLDILSTHSFPSRKLNTK